MLAALRIATTLMKLRIGIAIAASTLAGAAAPSGAPLSPGRALLLALAVLGASGAAGAFNHYYERDLDRQMARTRSRPFASGLLRPGPAWPLAFLAILTASLLMAYAAGGTLATAYVFLGAFTYGVVYTVWLKRRTPLNIVVGGLAGSFAVLAGAAAVDPAPQALPMVLAVVLFLWTPPHFWSLAAAKREEYARAGFPMLPVGAPVRLWTTAILGHTAVLVALSMVPLWYGMGLVYAVCAGVGGGLFVQRSLRLYRSPDPRTAMANFGASLVQLILLVMGVLLDPVLRILPWAA
jgi:protoheme IX farnesyltransferase